MKFTLETNVEANLVRAYGPGEISIKDRIHRQSLILTADKIVTDWSPQGVESVTQQDMQSVLDLSPEIVVLGTGDTLVFPDPEIMEIMGFVLGRGIGFEVMDTAAACRTYNILIHEGRRAVAALLL